MSVFVVGAVPVATGWCKDSDFCPHAKSQTRLSNWTELKDEGWGFPGGLAVKNPPAVWETRVWLLGQEGPLEEEMATHSSILAWEISWTKEPGRLQSIGSQSVRHDLATKQQRWRPGDRERGVWAPGWLIQDAGDFSLPQSPDFPL